MKKQKLLLHKNFSKTSFKEPRLVYENSRPGENSEAQEKEYGKEYANICKELPRLANFVAEKGKPLTMGSFKLGELSVSKDTNSTTIKLEKTEKEKIVHSLTITLNNNGLLTMKEIGSDTASLSAEYNPVPRFSKNPDLLFKKTQELLDNYKTEVDYNEIKNDFDKSKDAAIKDGDKYGQLMDEVGNDILGVP